MKLEFGPGGTGSPAAEGLREIKKRGLDCAEVEFTYGVNMTNGYAEGVGRVAGELGLSLSIHAPYYINLASAEKATNSASKKRILDTCERGHHMGAKYIVFHAAFYGKMDHESCYQQAKKEVLDMLKTIRENRWTPALCPETTGKGSQFGTYDELVRLSRETGCGVCVDFAHIWARNNGKIDYDDVMKKIKSVKGLTCHFSGIEYSEKGERRHLLTPPDRMRELLKYLKKHSISARIINESPDPVGDAVRMKKLWGELSHTK